jgi:hypothetical protein
MEQASHNKAELHIDVSVPKALNYMNPIGCDWNAMLQPHLTVEPLDRSALACQRYTAGHHRPIITNVISDCHIYRVNRHSRASLSDGRFIHQYKPDCFMRLESVQIDYMWPN